MNQQPIDSLQLTARDFFKYSTLVILCLLVGFQLLGVILKADVVPAWVLISIAFVCILYLWLAQRKDIDILHRTNVQLVKARDDLHVSHLETILSLVLSQEAKDSYTYGHSERVKQYSVAIAREMGLPEEEIETISRAAKLHDIGKIGIRDEILFFNGTLNDEQYAVIKTHPVKGVAILEPLRFLQKERAIVRHHHERYDGTGYPDGLAGDRIPPGARIVCVADAADAMRTTRPYKRPSAKEEIAAELQKNAGTQFDPRVVEAFIKNIDRFYR